MSAAPSVRANDIEPSPPQLRGSLSVTITIAANSSPSTSSPASTSTRTVRTSRSGDGAGLLPCTAAAAARPPTIATPPATTRATGPKPRELRREPRRAVGPAVTAVRPPWRTRGEATDPWCHRPRRLAATPAPRPVPSTRDRFAPAWPGPHDGPRRSPGADSRGRPGALLPGWLPPRLDGPRREQRRRQQAGPVPALPQQAGPVPGPVSYTHLRA